MKIIWVFSLAFLFGCSVGPTYIPPCADVPCEFKNTTQCDPCGYALNECGEFVYLDYWWEVFDDDKLNELESLVLANNRDLFVACERIQEARALMGMAAADLYPQITLNPQYTNTLELIKNYNSIPAILDVTKIFRAHELLYFLPLNLSYEVDLWGKIKDQYNSARFSWLGIRKDYEAVMLSLTSNLAIAYYQLRSVDSQIDLLKSILSTREKSYEINVDRYDAEIVFYAEVALAAQEVDTAMLQYHEAVRQRGVLEDQIAVLIGIPPSDFCLDHMPLIGDPPCIPEGIPSEVLLRRPDIAEAELKTKSIHALVKQAYAEFFPSLTLTATGGFESPIFKDFLKWFSRYFMEGVGINQVVFDGDRLCNQYKMQAARLQEANGQYQQLVLTAFQEVEDALIDIDAYAKEYDNAVLASQWAIKANELYSDRYSLGVINYIDVVNTERDVLNFQINQNSIQGFRYIATVQLIKALGGGWSCP